jgi:hypothetical protein
MTLELAASTIGGRRLFVLGCSQAKRSTAGSIPAIARYDGPLFRVLRSFLRDHLWPQRLAVAVLSAEHGLIGALSGIANYDHRLTAERARQIRPEVTRGLSRLLAEHSTAALFMGRDYLEAIDLEFLEGCARKVTFIDGGIGRKLRRLREHLSTFGALKCRSVQPIPRRGRSLYFLPDWDDFLDVEYDFAHDRLSTPKREGRKEAHSLELMRPHRICDGVLVSLAQHSGTKGLLRRVASATSDSLAPEPVREHFGLAADQWAFGDCGAFSYSHEEEPTISVEQAVAVYDLHAFDLGASVDHIPLPEIRCDGERQVLTDKERRRRVELTRANAEAFYNLARRDRARFLPVGVIQGIDAEGYANHLADYVDMGYHYVALGGLVPRADIEVLQIVSRVAAQLSRLRVRPWLHLMGIFRPRLQAQFRRLGVDSFDSATYFRKAWLRSDQNYLAAGGTWYAAIRVPPSHDGGVRKRLLQSGASLGQIAQRERAALGALRAYSQGNMGIEDCLHAVIDYDRLLARTERDAARIESAYRRTLEEKPWQRCSCVMCRELGVEVLIFRGLNRNKRRGAHNTLQLFQTLSKSNESLGRP